MALFGAETGFCTIYDRGGPVHWTNPEPRVVVPYGQAIAKDAPHPHAAKLFQEFVLSKAGQKITASTLLPSFRVGDLRKHVKEPWYNSPAPYNYDMEKIYTSMRGPEGLINKWNKIFLKK
jgi:ABC-type Fe3+ transport system substrate-binding protein